MDFKFDLQMFDDPTILNSSDNGPKSAFVGGSWIKESEVQQSADVLAYYDGTNYYVKGIALNQPDLMISDSFTGTVITAYLSQV